MKGGDCFHLDAGSSGIAWSTDITLLEIIKHIHVNDIVSILLSISYPRDVINSEYDQEIQQSQTTDKPMAPRGHNNITLPACYLGPPSALQ